MGTIIPKFKVSDNVIFRHFDPDLHCQRCRACTILAYNSLIIYELITLTRYLSK